MGMLRSALGELVAARMDDLHPGQARIIVAPVVVGRNHDNTWGVSDGANTYGPFRDSGSTVTAAVRCMLRHIAQEQD
jgi:hypothetical protein